MHYNKNRKRKRNHQTERTEHQKIPPHVVSFGDPEMEAEKQRLKAELKERVRKYIKVKFFWGLKFLDINTEAKVYQKILDKKSGIVNPGCFTDDEFRDLIKRSIRPTFTVLRHRSQSLARKNYMGTTYIYDFLQSLCYSCH